MGVFNLTQLLNEAVSINFLVENGINPRGEYDVLTVYALADAVTYNGQFYIAIQATTGDLPTDTDFWVLYVEKGDTGVQGALGNTGVQGNTGVKGNTGTQGIDGTTGVQGNPGNTGVKGDTGSQGVKGDTGTQGVAGNTGIQGTTGVTGASGVSDTPGDTGIQGSTGVHGNTGVQGVKGDTGTQGVAGNTGVHGNTGVQGVKGDTGTTGSAGAVGATGVAGAVGATGIHGNTGVAGVSDTPGDTGIQGDTGVTGAGGAAGAKGDTGTVGATGTTGAGGAAGNTGVAGAVGNTGVTGAVGNTGIQGDTGITGAAGNTGVKGVFGGDSFAWTYDDAATTDSDPGAGKFKLNNATITSVTQIYIDLLDAAGVTLTTWLDALDDASNGVKGTLKLFSNAAPTNWVVFNLTTWTTATGYRKLTVVYVAHNGTLPTTAGDIVFSFSIAGTKGDTGTTGAVGNTGVQGDTGVTGSGGVKGDTGTAGSNGAAGNTGVHGNTGVAGNTGIQGDTGVAGAAGNTGVRGLFGGQSFSFQFSTTTADADPGAGLLRFNNATYASVTQLFVDLEDANATDITAWLDSFDDVTNPITGVLKLFSISDNTKWVLFKITAWTTATGYRKLTVTYVSSNGALTTTAGDTVVTFTPAGYKGDTGTAGAGGAAGNTGVAGAVGATGTAGAVGATGTAGAVGATGTFANPMTTEVDMGENSGFALDAALSADGKYSGIVEAGTAGATLVFGNLCYLNNDDSRWELVDANLSDGYDKKLGMCVLAAAADGNATKMLLFGKINAASLFPALTVAAPVYMSETAGAIVVAQPTTADVAIRIIGFGNTGDELFFCPSPDYIVHV